MLKAISMCYTTLLANHSGPVCKHMHPFALVPSRKMKGMVEGNRFLANFLMHLWSMYCTTV